MTKYIKLDDMINLAKSWEGIKISNQIVCVTWGLVENIELLPTTTIPEPYKGTNWDLLQEYIDNTSVKCFVAFNAPKAREMLEEIQSRLVSDMPKVGEDIEVFNMSEEEWQVRKFLGYSVSGDIYSTFTLIRPISIPPEISSAIKLLEDSNYIVTKK